MLIKDFNEQIKLILKANHWDPFQVLGNHVIEKNGKQLVAIRAFLPEAEEAWIIRGSAVGRQKSDSAKKYAMQKIHKAGFFEAIFIDEKDVFPYHIRLRTHDGITL